MTKKSQGRELIKQLVTKGRELDAKLKELEAQAEAWPRIVATATKNNIGAPAARALLEEVQTTKREMKATSAEIEENRAALASFLAGMRVQATEAVAEAKLREDFMAQYGWQDSRPMGPPDENWSLPSWAIKTTEEPASGDILSGAPDMATSSPPEETPAAAAEFPNQDQNISRQTPPTPVQPVSNRKPAQPDSPSVFDIGLSDATIKMFVNKAKPHQAAHPSPLPTSSKALSASTSLSSRVTSTAPTYLSSSAKSGGREVPLSPSNPTCQDLETGGELPGGHDSTVGASPELQLRSALPSLQVNDSSLLPNMPDMSLSQSYAQRGEISPGLPCRATPEPQDELTSSIPPTLSSARMLHSASLDLSPELPQLQTINLRDIINPRRTQRSDTPEVPELQTVNLRDISNKSSSGTSPRNDIQEIPVLPASQTLATSSSTKLELRDTPEAPELSYNYRGHSVREASNTPEAPKLLSNRARALSESPETPVLQTINLRRSAK